MRTHLFIVAIVTTACFACRSLAALEQGGTEKSGVEKKAAASSPASPAVPPARLGEKLAEPLEGVTCGLLAIEESGYFALTDVRYARTEDHREEAMIWTIKVKKPLTCRHALALLRRFQDARFYDTEYKSRQELLVERLFYSSWIAEGAINRRILKPDDEFQLWIVLDIVAVRMLRSRGADTLEFREP